MRARAYEQTRFGLVLLDQVQVLVACGWLTVTLNELGAAVAMH